MRAAAPISCVCATSRLAPTHVPALSALPGVLKRSKVAFGSQHPGNLGRYALLCAIGAAVAFLMRSGRRVNMQLPSMDLGPVGIWTSQFDFQPAAKAREAAADLEKLGFGAIWFSESVGRELFTQAGLLLGATKEIAIATGIANLYGRDPVTTAAAQKTLAEAYPGRFLLGLGVSHFFVVEQIRGHTYGKPVAAMRAYLDGMDAAPYSAAPPRVKPARVLAALGPRMLQLAAERADGAHPYFVPPEHTAQARQILGSDHSWQSSRRLCWNPIGPKRTRSRVRTCLCISHCRAMSATCTDSVSARMTSPTAGVTG